MSSDAPREVGSVEKRHEAHFSHPEEFSLENLGICVLLTVSLILKTGGSCTSTRKKRMNQPFCQID